MSDSFQDFANPCRMCILDCCSDIARSGYVLCDKHQTEWSAYGIESRWTIKAWEEFKHLKRIESSIEAWK